MHKPYPKPTLKCAKSNNEPYETCKDLHKQSESLNETYTRHVSHCIDVRGIKNSNQPAVFGCVEYYTTSSVHAPGASSRGANCRCQWERSCRDRPSGHVV